MALKTKGFSTGYFLAPEQAGELLGLLSIARIHFETEAKFASTEYSKSSYSETASQFEKAYKMVDNLTHTVLTEY